MKKSQLIKALAEHQKLSIKTAASIVNAILDRMTEALVQGDKVELRGFGSFTVKACGAYTGKNPKTGEPIPVQPKKMPLFKAGKDLRESMNTNRDPENAE